MKTWLVGGAVRDALLGLSVQERDWVVVGATPEAMLAKGFRQVGKDFPVFLHPKTHEEYALARTERKTAAGYHGFAMHTDPSVTLEEDLLRRDLTINAIAQDPDTGAMVDPHGGLADLKAKVLRHVSPAFAEDPVRILRLARFAARFAPLGFTVHPDTVAMCRGMAEAGEVDALVPERVWKETERALCLAQPSRYFLVLRACGALSRLFPELAALFGVPQRAEYHAEVCSGVHTLMALDRGAAEHASSAVQTAVLCHDYGKARTPAHVLPKHIGHEAAGDVPVRAFCQRLRVPNASRDLALVVTAQHLLMHRAKELRGGTLLTLLENLRAFKDASFFAEALQAVRLDAQGRLGQSQSAYPQIAYLDAAAKVAGVVTAQTVMSQTGATGAHVTPALRAARTKALEAWRSEGAARL